MINTYAIMMLMVMLGVAFYFGIRGMSGRPKTKIRSADRILFRNRWYPIALSIYATIGIIHNLNQLFLGQRGVYIWGLALYSTLLATLLAKRGLLLLIINIWLVVTFLSTLARSGRFIQGNCSATTLREGLFSLLVAGLAYAGRNAYVSYYTAPPAPKGDT